MIHFWQWIRHRITHVFPLFPLIALTGLVPVTFGCSTVVVPPEQVEEPETVLLVDYGLHSSLILPAEDGGSWEYAYGEWFYYAKRRFLLLTGPPAVLFPTPGTLGRRKISADSTSENLRLQFVPEKTFQLNVEAERLSSLRERLDRYFRNQKEHLTRNDDIPLDFVPYEQPYWQLHNCNHEVVSWLEELGCETKGSAMWSSFHVRGSGEKPNEQSGED